MLSAADLLGYHTSILKKNRLTKKNCGYVPVRLLPFSASCRILHYLPLIIPNFNSIQFINAPKSFSWNHMNLLNTRTWTFAID